MGCPKKDLNLSIFCGNVPIDRVYKTKILGITFDPDLRFSTYIEELCSKINKRISFMSRLRHYVSLSTLNAIYKSMVLPHFDYGILLYGFTYDTHLSKLYMCQKRAARIITFSPWRTSCSSLFSKLNWMDFYKRVEYKTVNYIFKCLNDLTSTYGSHNFFKLNDGRCSRRLNDSLQLKIPSIKNNFLRNSIFLKGLKYGIRPQFIFALLLIIKIFYLTSTNILMLNILNIFYYKFIDTNFMFAEDFQGE